MPPDSIHQMSRSLGAVEASVKNLTETWQQQDREATEGRRQLHAKIDELRSQQSQLATLVAHQTARLAEIEPAIKRFEAQRHRDEGARGLGKIIWIVATTLAAGFGYLAHELIVIFWPPK